MLGCKTIVETPKRNILREVTNDLYISPNANLKLLTAVALKNASHRKDKSLQVLCNRFLKLYPLNGNTNGVEIQLDATAQKLEVEKRRIYDIINILEALQCTAHCRKNTYTWYGATKLEEFLTTLKTQGENLKISEVLHRKKGPLASPKQRSLGVLAQRFLMMFLVEPPNTLINLEMAVTVLISPPRFATGESSQRDRQHKSKVRRLYDISNVLSSIGLIEKVSGSTILKKPVFRYTGPNFVWKKFMTPPMSSTQLTPISLVAIDKHAELSYPSRSKRKLEFSSPNVTVPQASTNFYHCTPPPTPTASITPHVPTTNPTPSHKWNEILHVAGMELIRLNETSA